MSISAAACDTDSQPDRFPAGGAPSVTRLSGLTGSPVGYGEPVSRQRTILVLAVASQAAFSMITFGLPAIGVEIRERFDLGPAGFGAVFAAVGIGSAAALIPAGALVDRFGGRRVLVVGGHRERGRPAPGGVRRLRDRRTPRRSSSPGSAGRPCRWPG